MSPTSPADYPTLAFDPAPGDHDASHGVTGIRRDAADALAEIKSVLHGADDGEWRGQAAIAFRDLLDDEFRHKIDEAYRSFSDAVRVLDGWTANISVSQAAARRLGERAVAAAERIASANATIDGLPAEPGSDDPPPESDAERRQQEEDAEARSQAQRQRSAAQSADGAGGPVPQSMSWRSRRSLLQAQADAETELSGRYNAAWPVFRVAIAAAFGCLGLVIAGFAIGRALDGSGGAADVVLAALAVWPARVLADRLRRRDDVVAVMAAWRDLDATDHARALPSDDPPAELRTPWDARFDPDFDAVVSRNTGTLLWSRFHKRAASCFR